MSLNLISDAMANIPAVGGATGGGLAPIMMMVGFFAIAYFILIRPQMKRQKEHRSLLAKLSQGDEVVTSGGLVGTIQRVGDDFLEITIAENIKVTVQKQAVTSALPKGTLDSF